MIPPHNSLVKHDNPILVSTSSGAAAKASKASDKKGKDALGATAKKGDAPPSPSKGKGKAPGKDGKTTTQTEDILNSILPPREWTEVRATKGTPAHTGAQTPEEKTPPTVSFKNNPRGGSRAVPCLSFAPLAYIASRAREDSNAWSAGVSH